MGRIVVVADEAESKRIPRMVKLEVQGTHTFSKKLRSYNEPKSDNPNQFCF